MYGVVFGTAFSVSPAIHASYSSWTTCCTVQKECGTLENICTEQTSHTSARNVKTTQIARKHGDECRFVAGLQHVYQSWRKPFNPILGETWQAQLSDGTAIFMEQLSHHPPVTAFHMIGAGHHTCLPVQPCLLYSS